MTDMEGCSGVLNFEDYEGQHSFWYQRGIQILTEETNAAVDGFFAGGATAVTVMDGHGAGAIDPLRLDRRADLVAGTLIPPHGPYPFGLDSSYHGIAWVGQHARAGMDYSHLTHTGSCGCIDFSVNGISIGEYGQAAFCAMELGIPAFFASGEAALCREASDLTPGVMTVGVKEGLSVDGFEEMTTEEYRRAKVAARHLSHAKACELIRAGARKATRWLKSDRARFKFPTVKPPYVRVVRCRSTEGKPGYTTRDEDAKSIIRLLNKSLTKVGKGRTARPHSSSSE